ncbi:phosphate regulon sensor histidine kinase, putative [Pseudooceanicola batsensis HTCC2597]|uniref:histidine kinase n=1 Tax=Pseudooceanicola batsensis (strain ATCC BAA-863 / DSM 15984 / KCTC 12145 / HTCC2597) TaxID=252305 RepID=A3TXP6_PSEBH|nr:ATP-binding protein [Pseudooceanicola batsensis]EAQ03606.1 phosphate regulon sensor histidine kinase, putative [Pseudooceanicola batsensis HTCC2597]
MTEAFLTQLLQAIPLASVLIGRGERILAANSEAKTLLGSGIVGRHFITAIRHPAVLDAVEHCLGDRKTHRARHLTSQSGRDLTYSVTASYIDFSAGEGVLVCFDDITPVEQAGQMRRDFVANVSHELRTPLTALLGFIETLRGPASKDPAAQQRFLGIMDREAHRMERLVRDLLSLSRVEAEERVRPVTRVDIVAILESVQKSLEPLAAEAGVAFSRIDDGTPIHVPGDEDQLRQVFTNLIENAVKYGARGERVEVTVHLSEAVPSLRGPGVEVTVRDFGPGIEEIHIPRLTERFYRVDSHRSREMGGTGLGLAIVKHIVNRHRGRLRIESEPGQGCRFIVTLPHE